MKKVTLSLVLVVLFAFGLASAQNRGYGNFRGHKNGPGFNHKMPRNENPFRHFSLDDVTKARQELKLTDEQTSQLKQIRHEFKLAQVDRRAEIEKAQIELNSLKLDKAAAEKDVMAAIDKLAMSKAEQAKAQYRFRNQLRAVLTPEQLEKWDGLKKEQFPGMRREFRKRTPGTLGLLDRFDNDWYDRDSDDSDDENEASH